MILFDCQWKKKTFIMKTNITLINIEMVRSMLQNKKMPEGFWGKIIIPVSYLLNRCLTINLKNITSQEAWNSKRP